MGKTTAIALHQPRPPTYIMVALRTSQDFQAGMEMAKQGHPMPDDSSDSFAAGYGEGLILRTMTSEDC
jgi:hypothetical protein